MVLVPELRVLGVRHRFAAGDVAHAIFEDVDLRQHSRIVEVLDDLFDRREYAVGLRLAGNDDLIVLGQHVQEADVERSGRGLGTHRSIHFGLRILALVDDNNWGLTSNRQIVQHIAELTLKSVAASAVDAVVRPNGERLPIVRLKILEVVQGFDRVKQRALFAVDVILNGDLGVLARMVAAVIDPVRRMKYLMRLMRVDSHREIGNLIGIVV